MKLSKKQVLNLWRGLHMVSAGDHAVKFAYAIARNKAKLAKVIETLQEVIKPLDSFEKKRIELVQKHGIRREDGSLVSHPNGEHPMRDINAFNEELEVLRVETGQDKRDEEVEALLKEEEDFDVYMCSFENLPKEINPIALELLLPMISEPSAD